MIKFYQYPKCTTCKKAARFLDEHGVSYESIDIVQHTPTKQEFKESSSGRIGFEPKRIRENENVCALENYV